MREQERGHDEGAAREDAAPAPRGWTMRRPRTRRSRENYAAAFERVRLVRAWIAAAAALVAVLSGYVAVIERVMR
jgi:hypothetical protein